MKIITRTQELADICREFAAHPYVTVDTEFLRERTYWSQLCLVQIARPGDDAGAAVIIDPLAEGLDLAPLFDLMADQNVTKVFHAARQDIEIFYKLSGRIPAPLFDTQIAAMVCGYGEQVGYETLVRKIVKVELDKTSRFTDWSQRPLADKQLRYAIGDVTHLRQIYETLAARLEQDGRAHWVAEEMAILTDPATYVTQPEDAWRRIKARSSKPRFLAVIRELAKWREITAQARNVPRNRVIKDDALIEIASAKPSAPEDLSRLRLLQREARKPEIAAEILAAVARGLRCPPEDMPHIAPPRSRREGSAAISDLLRVFLKARADELGVASRLIATSSDLDLLTCKDVPDLAVLRGWRNEVFGIDALRIRDGKMALCVHANGVRLIEVHEE